MNTLVKYIGIALAGAALFTACKVDNYDQPNAWIHGAVIDTETNGYILQDLFTTNGSVLMSREQNFVDKFTGEAATTTERRDLNFKTDGTYSDKNFFSGTYEFSSDVKNFYYEPEIVEIVAGENIHNIETTPYVRVNVDSICFHPTECIVYAYFKVESTDETEAVKDAALFVDVNPNVSKTLNGSGDNSCKVTIGRVPNKEDQYRLKMSTQYMDAPGDFYFRVGAISSISQATYNYAPAVQLHIDNSQYVEPVVVLPGVQLDACDTADGWGGGFAGVYSDCREGSASVGATANANCVVMFQKVWDTPIDTKTTVQAGRLKWWFYCSDPSCLPTSGAGYSAQFEFCSGGACDNQELTVEWNKLTINAGWNEIEYPMASCANGGFVPTNFNFFRMYNTIGSGECTLAIDDLRVYAPDTFDDCESTDGWDTGLGGWSLDSDCREGEYCIKASGPQKGDLLFAKRYGENTFCAPCSEADGYFSFYFYVSDPSPIMDMGGDVQIELGSGNDPDKEESNWNRSMFSLSAGWNQMHLSLATCGHSGQIDLSRVNWVRMYCTANSGTELTIKLDKFGFYDFDE